MSDTDEEIPSSQPVDASMLSFSLTPSQSAQVKRARGDLTPEEQEDSQLNPPAGPMDEQLSCGICLALMHNPFLILPCMHSYCRECLSGWWREHTNCPICKQRSNVAKHNFQLASVILQYRKDTDRVSRRRLDDTAREDLYPLGRRPPRSLPSSYGTSQSQSQPSQLDPMLLIPSFGSDALMGGSQSQSNGSGQPPLPDAFPGGNLVFPCPSCYPDNVTGYTCPEPIALPTAAQMAAEQQAYRPGGNALRAPGRGEPRVSLQAARLNHLPGAHSHNQCHGCSTYMPAGWEPQKQKCADCNILLCSNYDPSGCPETMKLLPRSALSGGLIGAHSLWNTSPMHIRNNNEERRRFEQYLTHNHLTVDDILERLVDLKLQNEKHARRQGFPAGDDGEGDYAEEIREAEAECEARWGAEGYFCNEFVDTLIVEHFFSWWMEERRTGQMPAAFASLEDCWYGFDCRTQGRQAHAVRLNHVCPNTQTPQMPQVIPNAASAT